ncbi:hypothetical protein B0H16DRAFT_810967 [Mycena metata]|uniref:Uncharacterized protein n=1 Tax=Mycena metata TaxID=1033252 RepID=A0AAD7IWJ0_9AGAR|nr:hypothetical protein B0H16DRAFT_810967 [Mycena metata]
MVSPEFVILHHPGFTEYRVENWRLARDGSGRILMGVSGWTWQYSLLPLIVSLLWPRVHDNILALCGLSLALATLLYFKCTQVLFGTSLSWGSLTSLNLLHQESVVLIPPHGIQLETHRGLPWFSSFFVTTQFCSFRLSAGLCDS